MNGDDRFIQLWNDYLEGEHNEADTAELRRLIAADEQFARLAADMYAIHRLMPLVSSSDVDSAQRDSFVRETMSALPADENKFVSGVMGHIRRTEGRTAPRFAPWGIVAAAAMILLSVSLAAAMFLQPRVEPVIATITSLHGAMQWTGGGGRVELDLKEGHQLRGGTLESLAADSWAEIRFNDGSTMTASGRSMVTISDRGQKEAHLRMGHISATIRSQPKDRPLLIYTPTAELEVLGTQFNIATEPSSTLVTVNEGRVRVTRLADGSIAEVPADHQLVAMAGRSAEFKAKPRKQSVSVWKSDLTRNDLYGHLQDDGLRSKSLLWRGCEQNQQNPVLLFVSAIPVTRGERSVELREGAKFRIRGRVDSAKHLVIGLNTHHLKGGFAGKHLAHRPPKHFAVEGGEFELEVGIEEFKPEKPNHPKSPIGLGLYDFWALTVNEDAGLVIASAELIQDKSPGKTSTRTNAKGSIEERTKIHRLSSTKRSPFDAFVYVNRIPGKPDRDESPTDLAGRILGRLANQEGRVLLKLPTGMDRRSYRGFKTFLRYEGDSRVGNCAVCHTPSAFTDLKKHVVVKGGAPTVTPTLRNLARSDADLRKAIMTKITASNLKRSGKADEIDNAYASMRIGKDDVPGLVAFVKLLHDASDPEFRRFILDAAILDTSDEIERGIEDRKELQ